MKRTGRSNKCFAVKNSSSATKLSMKIMIHNVALLYKIFNRTIINEQILQIRKFIYPPWMCYKRNFRLCLHLANISVFEFNNRGSDEFLRISNFSDVHRSQLFRPTLYGCPRLIMLHLILWLSPWSFSDHTFSESLVSPLRCWCLNEELWLLKRALNVPSVIPI